MIKRGAILFFLLFFRMVYLLRNKEDEKMKRLMKKGTNKMKIIYALQDFPKEYTKSIFLAGPTPRDENIKSWRPDAIKALEEAGYDGIVFVPEQQNKVFKDYDAQLEWELEGLNRADCILFWIPRDLETMPAFTTNVEFGEWFQSGKVAFGFPKDSPKNTYLEKRFKELQLPVSYTLEDTVKTAIDIIGEGAPRKDGETYVPAYIWKVKEFQEWYQQQKTVGNELRYAKLNYVFTMLKAKKVFMWILGVHVWIKSENRVKENEFILSRTDTCDVLLYYKQPKLEDTIIVLVKEFRSPVNNNEGYIYELPGGSSIKSEENIDVIQDEIKEELGIDLTKDRFNFEESRQVIGTLSVHKSHLYSVELNNKDLNLIKEAAKTTHGVAEDTELTYIEIKTLKEIMSNNLLDWANIGKILSILYKRNFNK
jgi:8-oxo-dGTP pyrophosphatase MutT (NUDIX family)/nucleoside 2-deoxyribosyltransferase